MAQISKVTKVVKQELEPVAYNCCDYHEFSTIKDVLSGLFLNVVYEEIGYMGAYVAIFKTKGQDSSVLKDKLTKALKAYDDDWN